DTPEAIGELFSDVAANAYYAEAIIWASVEGIVSGTGDGFAPDAEINREQLAVMLYRYYVRIVGDGVLDVPSSGTLDRFPDAAEASDWAEEALKWAVAAGLIQGRDSGLAPKGTATRAEVAVILERFIENVL
ncbi:MAG: S-layer homology domain-containing protein, partial [Clostridiales Family XIII bacterium]|nr:S-layer homology domain-containing protein [Clostridiales Family XIII bacterium]